MDAPTDLCEEHRGSLQDADGYPPFSAFVFGHCGVSRQLMSSTSWYDVAVAAVSSASRANSTWWDGEGTSLTFRLNRTGDIIPT